MWFYGITKDKWTRKKMLVFPKTVNIQHGKTIHRRAIAVKSKKISTQK